MGPMGPMGPGPMGPMGPGPGPKLAAVPGPVPGPCLGITRGHPVELHGAIPWNYTGAPCYIINLLNNIVQFWKIGLNKYK